MLWYHVFCAATAREDEESDRDRDGAVDMGRVIGPPKGSSFFPVLPLFKEHKGGANEDLAPPATFLIDLSLS